MRRLSCILLAAVFLLAGLNGCVSATGTEVDVCRVWFVSDGADGSLALASEEYRGEWSVPALMEALLKGPSANSGLAAVIPEGTRLQQWSRSGSTVVIDLSQEYGSLVGVELTLADYCITLTVTQLDGVEGVCITVNGEELPYRSRQMFRREDVLFSGAEEEPVELTAALCFRRAGGSEIGVELRIFRLTESESATQAVLEALLAGPQEAGLTAILSPEIQVYSARVDEGICYADFSAALLTGVPASEEEQRLVIRSIVESLCSLGYVRAVQILVEGEPVNYYGTQDISQPLS